MGIANALPTTNFAFSAATWRIWQQKQCRHLPTCQLEEISFLYSFDFQFKYHFYWDYNHFSLSVNIIVTGIVVNTYWCIGLLWAFFFAHYQAFCCNFCHLPLMLSNSPFYLCFITQCGVICRHRMYNWIGSLCAHCTSRWNSNWSVDRFIVYDCRIGHSSRR